jgi:hypothetical protein
LRLLFSFVRLHVSWNKFAVAFAAADAALSSLTSMPIAAPCLIGSETMEENHQHALLLERLPATRAAASAKHLRKKALLATAHTASGTIARQALLFGVIAASKMRRA